MGLRSIVNGVLAAAVGHLYLRDARQQATTEAHARALGALRAMVTSQGERLGALSEEVRRAREEAQARHSPAMGDVRAAAVERQIRATLDELARREQTKAPIVPLSDDAPPLRHPAEEETARLAQYLDDLGEGVRRPTETAVDCAVRLLQRYAQQEIAPTPVALGQQRVGLAGEVVAVDAARAGQYVLRSLNGLIGLMGQALDEANVQRVYPIVLKKPVAPIDPPRH